MVILIKSMVDISTRITLGLLTVSMAADAGLGLAIQAVRRPRPIIRQVPEKSKRRKVAWRKRRLRLCRKRANSRFEFAPLQGRGASEGDESEQGQAC